MERSFGTRTWRISICTLLVLVATACASGSRSPAPTPSTNTSPAIAGSTPGESSPNVTLADSGRTITMRVGESFLLNLGAEGWQVTIADQNVVSRVVNIAVIRGAQGVYRALGPGETTLDALGPSPCPAATPSCGAPQQVFRVTIAVDQPRSGP